MRFALFLLLIAGMPQSGSSAPSNRSSSSPGEATSVYSNRVADDLKREPAATNVPGIRSCYYYKDNAVVYDIGRLEMHSSSCRANQPSQGISNGLPDRRDDEIYRVGEPFDVPKRN